MELKIGWLILPTKTPQAKEQTCAKEPIIQMYNSTIVTKDGKQHH
jgi:hypothetical protein